MSRGLADHLWEALEQRTVATVVNEQAINLSLAIEQALRKDKDVKSVKVSKESNAKVGIGALDVVVNDGSKFTIILKADK